MASHLTLESEIYQNWVHESNLPVTHIVMLFSLFLLKETPFTCRVIASKTFPLPEGITQIGEMAFIISCPWEAPQLSLSLYLGHLFLIRQHMHMV